MTRTKRLLAGSALLATMTVIGLGTAITPAQAAPKVTVQGNSGLEGGETLTVTVSGFTPGSPLAVGVCPTGRKLGGPGDCGPAGKGYSRLTQTDASGSTTTTLKIPPPGPLGNTTGAKAQCPPCSIAAATIGGDIETASVKLNYASAQKPAAPKPSATKKSSSGAGGAGDDSASTTATQQDDTAAAAGGGGAPTTAETGPRETAILALVALLLLQLGLMMYVRSVRSTPRRVGG